MVFLMAQESQCTSSAQLQHVVTIAMPAEKAATIVEALNTAAWSGDHGPLTALLESLPDAIVQSCREALARRRAPEELVLDVGGRPMRTLKHLYFGHSTADLVVVAAAAYDLGLQCMIRNVLSDGRLTEFEACIMSDEGEVDPERSASWWAVPEGVHVVDRFSPSPDELADVFLDERWDTQVGRMCWLWCATERRRRS